MTSKAGEIIMSSCCLMAGASIAVRIKTSN
jgi:hypothetical protein